MIEIEKVQTKIHEIRGQKVMLDYDLAELYEIETRRLKEAVRRNINRFPLDFMFELSGEEYKFLRSQIATLETGRGKYSKFVPFAFTELGVTMLSTLLKSSKAIETSIFIVRAFIAFKQFALTHKDLTLKLQELEKRYNTKFQDIEEALFYLMQKDKIEIEQKERKPIGFKV